MVELQITNGWPSAFGPNIPNLDGIKIMFGHVHRPDSFGSDPHYPSCNRLGPFGVAGYQQPYY